MINDKYDDLMNLKEKNILIVGGTGGLGSEMAKAFFSRGSNVIVTGRSEKKYKETFSDLDLKSQGKIKYLYVDLLSEESINNMTAEAIDIFGQIDVLINSAGINILKPAAEYDSDSFNKVMNININSVHLICKNVGINMIKNNKGSIINISSMKSILGTDEDYIAYCASKSALNMYTKQLACEWAKYNIRCNAIAPTFIKTEINKEQLENNEFRQNIINRIPLRRLGKKEDIAKLSLFLASDDSSFITGQVLFLDGGLTARQ